MTRLAAFRLSLAVTAAVVLAPTATQSATAAYADTPVSTARVVVPMVFPVLGPNTVSDTFLVCRDGCARRHFGQDLMGPKMRPLVAAFTGVVSSLRRETAVGGGNYLTIKGDNGWSANYIHVNNDRPGTDDGRGTAAHAFAPGLRQGSRVFAGQLVGWSGDSGNAESTAPHLHFELRRGDAWSGTVYNAYPSLLAAARIAAPRVSGPHPEGVLVRSCSTCPVYQLSGGKKHFLRGEVALPNGLDPRTAVVVAPVELAWYPTGTEVALPGGRVYRDPEGKLWLALSGKRIPVPDLTALEPLGIKPDRVRPASAVALATLPLAPADATLPAGVVFEGALLRETPATPEAVPALWYVRGGVRRVVPDTYTLHAWGLRIQDAVDVAPEVAAAPEFPPLGPPLVLPDGPVVKDGANRLYVVSNGTRRAFPDWAVYRTYGWASAIVTAAPLADVYRLPAGPPLP